MKILHIFPRYWPAYGGAEYFATVVSSWSAQNPKNQVDVWTTDADEVDALWFPPRKKFKIYDEIKDNVHIKRFKTTPFLMNNIFINKAIRYLLVHNPIPFLRILGTPPTCFDMWMQILRKDLPKYDVVHVGQMPYFSLMYIARAVARKTGAKFYLTAFTHIGTEKKDRLHKIYFDKVGLQFYLDADKIFVQTPAEKQAIVNFAKENGKAIPDEKFELVGLGIFPDQISNGKGENFRKKYGIPTEIPIVFSVGARNFVKGSLTLVKAMEKLWNEGLKAKLVFAGNTTVEFENFWNTQSDIVKANTILMTAPTDEEKFDLFGAGNLFSLVSKSESFGIVYLESWVYKKPVIACNIEAVSQVVSDGVDGYLVNFDDVSDLSIKIKDMLSNPMLSKKMGESGYNKVMNNYTWEKKFQILHKYFNE